MGGGNGGTVASLEVNTSGCERMARISLYLVTMWALSAELYSIEDFARWFLRSRKRVWGLVNGQVCAVFVVAAVVMVGNYGLQCG